MPKIVLADDESYILHVLAIKLRNSGFEVFTADDGAEALELCKKEQPDLVITDFQMPLMTGLELCREYNRLAGRRVPAMIITAREFDIQEEELAQSGVEIIIGKPFSPRRVVETAKQLLGGESAAEVA
jgi:CheY-like chemotaxis protein